MTFILFFILFAIAFFDELFFSLFVENRYEETVAKLRIFAAAKTEKDQQLAKAKQNRKSSPKCYRRRHNDKSSSEEVIHT